MFHFFHLYDNCTADYLITSDVYRYPLEFTKTIEAGGQSEVELRAAI